MQCYQTQRIALFIFNQIFPGAYGVGCLEQMEGNYNTEAHTSIYGHNVATYMVKMTQKHSMETFNNESKHFPSTTFVNNKISSHKHDVNY